MTCNYDSRTYSESEYHKICMNERIKYQEYWDAIRALCLYGRGESSYNYHVNAIIKYGSTLYLLDDEIRALIIAIKGTRKLLRKASKGDDTPKAVEVLEVDLEILEERLSQAKIINPNSKAWSDIMLYLRK